MVSRAIADRAPLRFAVQDLLHAMKETGAGDSVLRQVVADLTHPEGLRPDEADNILWRTGLKDG